MIELIQQQLVTVVKKNYLPQNFYTQPLLLTTFFLLTLLFFQAGDKKCII
jgi:hypothetical protein